MNRFVPFGAHYFGHITRAPLHRCTHGAKFWQLFAEYYDAGVVNTRPFPTFQSHVMRQRRRAAARSTGPDRVGDLLGCGTPPCGVVISTLVDFIKLAGQSPSVFNKPISFSATPPVNSRPRWLRGLSMTGPTGEWLGVSNAPHQNIESKGHTEIHRISRSSCSNILFH